MQEYWVLFVPVFLALSVIFYFIYHIRHTDKYSGKMVRQIEEKIRALEERGLIPEGRMRQLVGLFKDCSEEKISLFELERKMGIDMETFILKIDHILKKN